MPPQAPSYKVFDAITVTGANTYYSGSSRLGSFAVPGNAVGTAMPNGKTLSYAGQLTGNPTGSITIEGSNSSDEDVRLGRDFWFINDQVNGAGFTAGVATVTAGLVNGLAIWAVAMTRNAFFRSRIKQINTSGAGTSTAVACSKAI
jgi:hypothetical protein